MRSAGAGDMVVAGIPGPAHGHADLRGCRASCAPGVFRRHHGGATPKPAPFRARPETGGRLSKLRSLSSWVRAQRGGGGDRIRTWCSGTSIGASTALARTIISGVTSTKATRLGWTCVGCRSVARARDLALDDPVHPERPDQLKCSGCSMLPAGGASISCWSGATTASLPRCRDEVAHFRPPQWGLTGTRPLVFDAALAVAGQASSNRH
jgi:hypothetical protein